MMDKAKLINKEMPLEFVIFNINPSKISISKQVQQATQGRGPGLPGTGTSGSTEPRFQHSDPVKLKLTNLYVEGLLCKPIADMMYGWMTPWGGPIQQAIQSAVATASGRVNLDYNTPTLIFQWGPPILGFVMQCKLTSITMDFTRFSPLGTPTRMFISNLELYEVWDFSIYALTNPTSGGKPGRAGRTLTDGETLQHVSREKYGQPQYWRALAEANKIDDPMRVRAGDNVYLPSIEEVVTSGPGAR